MLSLDENEKKCLQEYSCFTHCRQVVHRKLLDGVLTSKYCITMQPITILALSTTVTHKLGTNFYISYDKLDTTEQERLKVVKLINRYCAYDAAAQELKPKVDGILAQMVIRNMKDYMNTVVAVKSGISARIGDLYTNLSNFVMTVPSSFG